MTMDLLMLPGIALQTQVKDVWGSEAVHVQKAAPGGYADILQREQELKQKLSKTHR